MPDLINGVPLVWDDGEDLFGRLFKSAGPSNSPFSGNTSPLITNAFPNESALPDVVFFDKSAADIIADKFRNAKNNSIAGIQIVEDPDCDCDLYEKVYPVVYPVIKSGGVNQMKLTKLTVLVSSNSAKLAICYAACSRIESGEAVLFYDTTQNELKAKIGKDAEANIKAILKYANLQSPAIPKQMGSQQSTVLDFIRKKTHKASAVILDILIQTLGYLICLVGLPLRIIGHVCELFGNWIIEELTIGEKFWNSEHPEYVFTKIVDGTADSVPSKESLIKILSLNENALDGLKVKIQQTLAKPEFSYINSLFKNNTVERVFNSLRNFIRKINTNTKTLVESIYNSGLSEDDLKKVISGRIAGEVGFLNGLVDFVAGLFLFVAFAYNFPFDFWISADLDVFIELFDKTLKLIEQVEKGELKKSLKDSLSKFLEDINELDLADINTDKIAYGLGFIAAFIATLFIPFTQEAKLRNLKKVLNILPEGILEQAASAVGAAEILAGKVKNKAIVLLDDIIKFVNKSYAELKKFFDDLFAKIKDWLLKAKDNFTKAGKLTLSQIDYYVALATKQGNKSKVMFGKFDNGKSTGYVARAGTEHTYFDLGNKWDEVYNLVNKSADEIWKINQKFIDNQKALGKEFYLSHDPSVATGFYYREVQYLTKPVNQGGLGGTVLNQGNNLWKIVW